MRGGRVCRRSLLNVAVALLLAAGLPLPAPTAPASAPAPTPAPAALCADNSLCHCRHRHLSCAGVPLHTLPALDSSLQHVVVSLARLEVLPESALDHLALQTLVLVADGLSRIEPRAFLAMANTLASLDLGYNEFTEIPMTALQDLKVLNWLSLQNNHIENLEYDTDWGFLSESLSILSLSNNYIHEIKSGTLKNLKHLIQLDLEGNRIRHLEADSLPPSLVVLRMSDNLLHRVPCDMFTYLPRLRHFYLRNNALRSSHNQTCHLNHTRRMDSIDLSHNELNNEVQIDIFRKIQLKHLVLDFNDLTAIPSFVYDMNRLEKLSVSYNKLEYISEHVLKLLKHGLQQLELDHNMVSSLPLNVRECSKMRHLSLNYNTLEDLKVLPPRIQWLSLAGNFLVSFPVVLKSLTKGGLTYLDLSYNQISQLSSGDFDVWSRHLITLNLKGNRLTQLSDGVFPMMPIREIILSFNDLYFIDPNSFANVSSTLQLLEFSSSLFSGEFPFTLELERLSWMSFDNNNIHIVTSTDIQNYPSLEYLNLEYNKLLEFPINFSPSTATHNLKELRLSYNFISRLNSYFLSEMKYIHSIDLSYNRVQNLSERSFSSLPNLVYLNLAGNVIDLISERTFSHLPRLEMLDLHENYLTEFSTNYFENVSSENTSFSLNISDNNISYMYGDRFVPVNVIDLSYNLMSIVPKSFFISLGPHVRQIIFSNNKLTHLDNSGFGSLPKLEILSLNRNNISIVKRRAFNDMSSLQILDLSHNAISQISVEQFHNMRLLRYLMLNNNLLRYLPRDVFKNTVLEHIDLNSNNIAIFPSSALSQVGFTLRYLDISSNRLEYIDPSMLHSFSFLLELNLSHNLLTVLSDNTFSSLGRLRKLNLSFNSIKSNFKELFHNLPNLRYLDLANVGLKNVPYLPLSNLTVLNLTANHISHYREADIKMLKNLRVLNLSYNRLTSIQPAMWATLNKLNSLDISHNPIVRITQGTFKGLENLSHLQMKGLRFVEVIDRKSFRHLLSLRSLDIQLLSSFSQNTFSLADIVAATPNIEKLVVHINEEHLTHQLHDMNTTKLRHLELQGERLKFISEDAFKGLERLTQLFLKISETSISELPHAFMKHLALIPHLGLDLSNNKLTTLSPAAFYPNVTSWSHVATKLLSDGLVLSGNPLKCGCEVAWVGAWLRRWLAESAGAAGGPARESARASACVPPAAAAAPGPARPLPLLQLDADEAECHASALSSRATRHSRPLLPHRGCSRLQAAFMWTLLVFSLS